MQKRDKSRMSPMILTFMMEEEVLPLVEKGKHKGRENLEILRKASFVKVFHLGHFLSELPVRHLRGDVR